MATSDLRGNTVEYGGNVAGLPTTYPTETRIPPGVRRFHGIDEGRTADVLEDRIDRRRQMRQVGHDFARPVLSEILALGLG